MRKKLKILLYFIAILFLTSNISLKTASASNFNNLKHITNPLQLNVLYLSSTWLFDPYSAKDEYSYLFTSPKNNSFQCTSQDTDGGLEPMYGGKIKYKYNDSKGSYNGVESDEKYKNNLVERWCNNDFLCQTHIECFNGIICDSANYNCRCKHSCEVNAQKLLSDNSNLSHYKILLNLADICMSQYVDDSETAVIKEYFITIGPKDYVDYLQLANQNLLNCYNKVQNIMKIVPPWSKIYLRFGIAGPKDYKNKTLTNAILRTVTISELDEAESNSKIGAEALQSKMIQNGVANDLYMDDELLQTGVCMGVIGHEMVHLFLSKTPIPKAPNEGLATYVHHVYISKDILEMGLPAYSEDDIICDENSYSIWGRDEKYYSDTSQPNAMYFSGYCFWKEIDDGYGHDVFLNIINRLALKRFNINGVNFIYDILVPEIGADAEALYNKYHLDDY